MDAISYTAARANLAKTMRKVCDGHEAVIITRRDNDAVVMLSLEDYEALTETANLLRSPRNARRLLDAIEELGGGGGKERDLVE